MAEPAYKRARRPDSKQMWDESDRRAPLASRERDVPRDRRDGRDKRDEKDRDRERDRNQRYRSRSPRDSRDPRAARDRDREWERGRGGRDSRDVRDSRGSGRGGDDSRRDRDKKSERNGARDRNRDPGEYRQGPVELALRMRSDVNQGPDRDSKEKPSERTKSKDNDGRRSRSPRRERESEGRLGGDKGMAKLVKPAEEFTKSRTATPPVSFRVDGSGHDAQDHDRMDMDGEPKHPHIKGSAKVKEKVEEESILDDDEIIIEHDDMATMQAMMGFGGFGSTHQKKVAGNDISAVRKEKKTEYRQYMNRVGGFNRPLSPPRE